MRAVHLCAVAIILIGLSGCEKVFGPKHACDDPSVVKVKTLVFRVGTFYAVNSDVPFSGCLVDGKVSGTPDDRDFQKSEAYENRNGFNCEKCQFIDGQPNGRFLWTRSKRVGASLEIEESYVSGKRDGVWALRGGFWFHACFYYGRRAHYSDGDLEECRDEGTNRWEVHWSGGKKNGSATFWHGSFQKWWEENYLNDELDGTATWWNVDGQKTRETNYVEGEKHGIETEWYVNGQKKRETHYVKGKLHGIETSWREYGQKWWEESYLNDELNGTATRWNKGGQKESETHYVEGKEHGIETQWYEDGQKKRETHYVEGGEHGIETEWYVDGQKRLETHYAKGKRHGFRTKWENNGEVDLRMCYRAGVIVSDSNCQ